MMQLNFRKYLFIALLCGSVGYGLGSQQELWSKEGLTDTASSHSAVSSNQCMNPSAPKSVGILLTELTELTDAASK